MKVVITGGTGFVGTNLSRHLLARGHDVKILDDLSSGLESNVPDGAQFIKGTIVDAQLVKQTIAGADAVVHLGARGSVPRSIKNPIATHEVNATGTLNVLEGARAANAHYLFSSSSSVYGANIALPKNEEMVLKPLTPYAASKMAGEALSLAYAKSYNLPVTTFRFFNIFGPWQRPDHAYAAVIPKWIWQAMEKQEIIVHGDGEQTRDFTSAATAVAVITSALENKITRPEPVNLAFGNRISLNEIVKDLQGYFPDLKIKHIETRPGDVKDSQNQPTLIKSLFPDVTPQSFKDALLETKNWLAENSSKILNGPAATD